MRRGTVGPVATGFLGITRPPPRAGTDGEQSGRRKAPASPVPARPHGGSAPVRAGPPGRPSPRDGARGPFASHTGRGRGSRPTGPVARPSSGPSGSGTGRHGCPSSRPRHGRGGRDRGAIRGRHPSRPPCPWRCAPTDRVAQRPPHVDSLKEPAASDWVSPRIPPRGFPKGRFPRVSPAAGGNTWAHLNTRKEAGGARTCRSVRVCHGNWLFRAGALGGIRTHNLLIRSQMLYPLSYERRI